MINPKTLLRADRIKMFINEYYFGYSWWITLMRIVGGPLLIFMGIRLYGDQERFGIAYGGFCIIYGLYYTIKPVLWILFRQDSFKSVQFEIEVSQDKLMIRDSESQSEVLLDGLQKIMKRKSYFALQLTKQNKIYLPFSLLTSDQISVIDNKIKT